MTRRGAGAVAAALLLAPALGILLLLRVYPAAQAIQASFTSWSGFGDPKPVGLANYVELANDPAFLQAMKNVLLIVATLPVWVIAPFVVASLIHDRPRGWRVFRVIMFLPAALSAVVIGSAFNLFLGFDGPLNTFLRAIGLGGLAGAWLADGTLAMPTLIAIVIWASLGVGVMVFIGALAQVNPELIDAARVDGASWLQREVYVLAPSVMPTIEFYAVISVITILSGLFPYVYTLTYGGPGYSTYVPEFDLYQTAFKQGEFGYASAMGVVLLLILVVLVAILLRTFRERA